MRQRSLRDHNLALVLRHVTAANRPPSRAEIAAASGLTRATVSTIVDELIVGGLVAELEPVSRSGVGRPGTGIVPAGTGPAGLGMEVNVDYLAVCAVDLTGAVRHRQVRRLDQREHSPAQTWQALGELADQAVAAVAAQGLTPAGGVIAVPGLVEGDTIRIAPNLGWQQVALPRPEDLGGPRHLPLDVANEATLAALGERHATGLRSFLYVSGEIGIGGGIVLDGELFGGSHGWAGEIGHVTIDPQGPDCHCGSRGCLEQYAGEEAIRAAAGLRAGGAVLPDLVDGARQGSGSVLEALEHAGTALGVALSGAVNLLDIGTVVLGGHYAELIDWLRPAIERELARRVITAGWAPAKVRASALGSDAALVGAARAVTQAILDDPARFLATRPAPAV
ncbi:ROK family transcriptional regulator [Catellatospora citrea]|uniref:Transcriptional regulator n=1 Tax=Catellatospora citrea TaxID=53366 RepID=A0A8J3KIV0_9ACTN|nr:ROK family transcriptional regulator [Catellatospora citrea]GIG01655.1 transcriptional regulator [Catellatospora citrea]